MFSRPMPLRSDGHSDRRCRPCGAWNGFLVLVSTKISLLTEFPPHPPALKAGRLLATFLNLARNLQ